MAARTAAPTPKPSLLQTMGLGATEAPSEAAETPQAAPVSVAAVPESRTPAEPPHGSQVGRVGSQPSRRVESQKRAAEPDAGKPGSPADATLQSIRLGHRTRRLGGAKPLLAPINVDVPAELLDHLRVLSADIPYPLRRIVEEALELWLVATANTE